MGRPSKKTVAENAVKSALEAAQAFVDTTDPESAAVALEAANVALADAVEDVGNAGAEEDFATTLDTVREMIGGGPATPPAPPAPPAPAPADYHTIAEGKALTSKRGILGPGARIDPDDLPGGDKALKAFVKSGHVLAPAKS